MRFADIRSALIQSWIDGGFGLDTAYPNKKFEPTGGTAWAALFILPNQPEVATLGERGEDIHDGVYQISLFYPPDQGDADIMAKADAVAQHYTAGKRYTYDGQGVLIRSCGRSQGRLDDGWYRIDLTVNWQSHVSRAPSCSITLTTEFNALSGRKDAQIDGQRLFIDNVSSSGNYQATTDVESPTSLWASGTRWIELQDVVSPANGDPFAGFAAPDGSLLFRASWVSSTAWRYAIFQNGSVVKAETLSGNVDDDISVGIDSNGDCRAIRNGIEESLPSEFSGFWTKDVTLYGGFLSAESGDSGSIAIATDGSNYGNDFSGVAGDNQDWCGNTI